MGRDACSTMSRSVEKTWAARLQVIALRLTTQQRGEFPSKLRKEQWHDQVSKERATAANLPLRVEGKTAPPCPANRSHHLCASNACMNVWVNGGGWAEVHARQTGSRYSLI
mmetsp:Transcript_50018/g.106424  ORF Transcript_50018/g.106424 Transcript_50018/m.106424 type:complete len:111 (-) Transcript_50018:108-440(-)